MQWDKIGLSNVKIGLAPSEGTNNKCWNDSSVKLKMFRNLAHLYKRPVTYYHCYKTLFGTWRSMSVNLVQQYPGFAFTDLAQKCLRRSKKFEIGD